MNMTDTYVKNVSVSQSMEDLSCIAGKTLSILPPEQLCIVVYAFRYRIDSDKHLLPTAYSHEWLTILLSLARLKQISQVNTSTYMMLVCATTTYKQD